MDITDCSGFTMVLVSWCLGTRNLGFTRIAKLWCHEAQYEPQCLFLQLFSPYGNLQLVLGRKQTRKVCYCLHLCTMDTQNFLEKHQRYISRDSFWTYIVASCKDLPRMIYIVMDSLVFIIILQYNLLRNYVTRYETIAVIAP